ncbi:hypothetical protein NPIL_420391 [Nephila pilipes]|uniref:Uncharacterized protein n=1 Tax=Nephila pilipes TaxID=299642 RepID=A0A8X6MI76_NEPPI|nr:hypothetical protein NPIL_420391 [Nephila pilipes]
MITPRASGVELWFRRQQEVKVDDGKDDSQELDVTGSVLSAKIERWQEMKLIRLHSYMEFQSDSIFQT